MNPAVWLSSVSGRPRTSDPDTAFASAHSDTYEQLTPMFLFYTLNVDGPDARAYRLASMNSQYLKRDRQIETYFGRYNDAF
jgi:hypothetical protein